jgi:hypothetical protein
MFNQKLKQRRILEAETQRKILDWLQIQEVKGNLINWRSNSFAGTLTRPDGSKGYVKNNKKGLPDICVVLNGGAYLGIEVKSSTGKMSVDQIAISHQFKRLKANYICVSSFEEFLEDYRIISKQNVCLTK